MHLSTGSGEAKVEKVPFLMLGLDLPPAPLYKDKDKKDIIPQVQFFSWILAGSYISVWDQETFILALKACSFLHILISHSRGH